MEYGDKHFLYCPEYNKIFYNIFMLTPDYALNLILIRYRFIYIYLVMIILGDSKPKSD